MIFKATKEELDDVVKLALKLWPNHTFDEFIKEFTNHINETSTEVFIAQSDDRIIGFAQVGLRHDYVEGTSTSPVGYLEGIYIEEEYRKRGIASELVRACEAWSLEKECAEFASDIEMNNKDSYKFHLKFGFTEANRLICFTKKLI